MEATIYELIQKRKELVQELDDLRSERSDAATKKVQVEDREEVDSISLNEYRDRAETLMDRIAAITVALREVNVSKDIEELGLTPEEARIRRDALDKEIRSLRGLKDAGEESLLRRSSDVVEVSRVDTDELDRQVKELTEERGELDAALQRFNLTTEIAVDI